MDAKWICLTISSAFHHGDEESVILEIQRIFGDDFRESIIVCGDEFKKTGEFYFFVLCTEYQNHISGLRDSAAVLGVVPSYNKPDILSRKEVDVFKESVDKKLPSEKLIYCDMVKVNKKVNPKSLQYLSGLHGLVVGYGKRPGTVRVYFRFKTNSFMYVIASTSLEFLGNILQSIRIPPFKRPVKRKGLFERTRKAKALEAVNHLVSSDKICRKQRRKLEKPYNCR